jgi:hypothetical protein
MTAYFLENGPTTYLYEARLSSFMRSRSESKGE